MGVSEADLAGCMRALAYFTEHPDEWTSLAAYKPKKKHKKSKTGEQKAAVAVEEEEQKAAAVDLSAAELAGRVKSQVRQLSLLLEKNEFDGKSRKEWVLKRVRGHLTALKKTRDSRIKQLDMEYINKRQLRGDRIAALESLVVPTNVLKLTHVDEDDHTHTCMQEDAKVVDADPSSSSSSSSLSSSSSGAKKRRHAATGPDAATDLGDGSRDDAQRHCRELVDLATETEDREFEKEMNKLREDGELYHSRSCYVCKKRFTKLHEFYDQLCPECATVNWTKRNQTAPLEGKYALLTGSRVKIGFRCGLKLLRCGAFLIATSRFPHDTAKRYMAEADSAQWKDRLHVFGVDLRDLKSVIRFCDILKSRYPTMDVIVNNAAQTIRRPVAYYRHLVQTECLPRSELSEDFKTVIQDSPHNADAMHDPDVKQSAPTVEMKTTSSSSSSSSSGSGASSTDYMTIHDPNSDDVVISAVMDSVPGQHMPIHVDQQAAASNAHAASAMLATQAKTHPEDHADAQQAEELFPVGYVDVEGQQLDLRRVTSWVLTMHQVEPAELVETFAVNTLAPFIINSRLKELMLRVSGHDKYIINVSAMEGKFYRTKSICHPHTNMAKAALNMMTRTSGEDYASSNIFMNSVDTGWINDEQPYDKTVEIFQTNFQTPIDEEDAMARILDPVLDGYNTGNNPYGKFYKDFRETEW
jgi:NAD(P)-dependent dehydrogenase (short-subunit alcohol dehydrogenase family)